MDYEREKGRIAGLKTRRRKTADWAMALLPFLEQARAEIRPKEGCAIPHSTYAKWLNDAGHRAREGGPFHPPTISRLFDIHIGLIDDVEQAFDIEYAIADWHRKRGSPEQRNSFSANVNRAQQERIEGIKAARLLSGLLRGEPLPEQEIPPRFVPKIVQQRPPRRPMPPTARIREPEPKKPDLARAISTSDEQGELPFWEALHEVSPKPA